MAAKGKPRVSRAGRPAPEGSNPGLSRASLSAQAKVKPGQMSAGKTAAAAVPAKDGSQVAMRPGRGVRDRSSAATGSSIFEKADAGNRRLGNRKRA